MTLANGDLTTPARVEVWVPNLNATASAAILAQLIGSCSTAIYGKLNRPRLFNQTITRTFDGVGTYQLVLPDYPVTKITKVQMGAQIINPYPLPNPVSGVPTNTFGYGYRAVLSGGESLPGQPTVLEFVNGIWRAGAQNIQVTYNAGYLVENEPQTIPAGGGVVTVNQPRGICSVDAGVVYAATGVALTPVSGTPSAGQYNPPKDTALGQYNFATADQNLGVLISYSFIPADLEEGCIQFVAERQSYRARIGLTEKSLGGQETMRYLRGGNPRSVFHDLPPEVEGLIWPYVSVIPPAIGAPV